MATIGELDGVENASSILKQARSLFFDKTTGTEAPRLVLALSLAILPLLIFLLKFIFPSFDLREPPVLRPKIPVFGHVISMIREGTSWYRRLYNEFSMPICTLPMLHGKIYVINSPDLISSALRNSDISFDPFLIEFSEGLFGLNKRSIEVIAQKSVIDELIDTIHNSLMGEPLYKMNVVALTELMKTVNRIETIDIPETYPWIWDLMGNATMLALFGSKNPITLEHMHLVSEFEEGVARLALGIAPQILAPGPLRARSKLNEIMEKFYANGHEKLPDVSAILQRRAVILRSHGLDNSEISSLEATFPFVATTNTIPTLFWLFVHLFSRPDQVAKVREEIAAITTVASSEQGRVATISAKEVDKKCPFYLACYREVLRMYIHNVGNRRVMKDTTVKDSQGRQYLLKEGTNVQWSTSLTHVMDSVWGNDAVAYRPERFVQVSPQDEKRRRGANIPFGGGKHLCPGRNFALAENLGFIGVLALGFNVTGVHVPESEDPTPGTGARKPVWGSTPRSAKIERRIGWEDVTWKFIE